MIKKMAWNLFKKTGDINSYLELVEVENIEKNIEKNTIKDECNKMDKRIKEDLN